MQMSKNIYFKYRHIFKYFILNVSIILTPFCAIAGFFGPSSYSDCVEKYVKVAKCDNSVFILNRTCIMQFDENKNSPDWKVYYKCVRKNLANVDQEKSAYILTRSCQKKHSNLFYLDWRGFYVPIEQVGQFDDIFGVDEKQSGK